MVSWFGDSNLQEKFKTKLEGRLYGVFLSIRFETQKIVGKMHKIAMMWVARWHMHASMYYAEGTIEGR